MFIFDTKNEISHFSSCKTRYLGTHVIKFVNKLYNKLYFCNKTMCPDCSWFKPQKFLPTSAHSFSTTICFGQHLLFRENPSLTFHLDARQHLIETNLQLRLQIKAVVT